jgi:predicted enzyme related to lactoylglutathione lyase
MAYLHGKFVWFEHVSNDVQKSRIFYSELFGWRSDPVPMGDQQYHMIQNAGKGSAASAQPCRGCQATAGRESPGVPPRRWSLALAG